MSMATKEMWEPWREIPKEVQDHISSIYKALRKSPNDEEREWATGLEFIFGKENVENKPQIKNWQDVVTYHPEVADDLEEGMNRLINYYSYCGIRYLVHCQAMLKIERIIELGYGGMITNSEWEDDRCRKYVVRYLPTDDRELVEGDYCIGEHEFIAFHTEKQREMFMSDKSNRDLVINFFMI